MHQDESPAPAETTNPSQQTPVSQKKKPNKAAIISVSILTLILVGLGAGALSTYVANQPSGTAKGNSTIAAAE